MRSGVTVHVVLDDFGSLGRSYRETDEAEADLDSIIDDLFTGQYSKPVRVVAFNTAEGRRMPGAHLWSPLAIANGSN